jgi:Protein of unknown function (DUF4240)
VSIPTLGTLAEVTGVDREQFWELVETATSTAGPECEQQAAALAAALSRLPPSEILAFHRIQDELMAESYRWELWGAAYLMMGGCSDDGFDYFRGWLLTQGRAAWEAALRDPDGLATHSRVQDQQEDFWCEDMLYAAFDAYEARTGQPFPPAPAGRVLARLNARPPRPSGEEWDFGDEEEMRRRYPKLSVATAWLDEE